MKVKAVIPIPVKDRLKILWHGAMYVCMDYRGQHEPMRIEAAPVNKKGYENGTNNDG